MATIISSAKWTATTTLEVNGQNFKDSPLTSDVEVNNNSVSENAFFVTGTSAKYNVTTLEVKKGDAGAKVRVKGSDGQWSSFKNISE